jgi:hypothetical protein
MPLDNLTELRRVLHASWANARGHAAKKKLEFSLPEGFAEELYTRHNGRCAVTAVTFSLEPSFPKALVKHPMAPSIDRRLSTGGYTEDNVRLVCVAVNFGMGQWGEETYLTLARAAIDYSQKKGIDGVTDVRAAVRGAGSIPAAVSTRIAGQADWRAVVRERLEAAEKLLPLLPENQQKKQRQRIAGFKAALTLGLARARHKAGKAWRTIRSRRAQ